MLTIRLEGKFGSEEVAVFKVHLAPLALPDLYRKDGRLFAHFCERGMGTFVYRERTVEDAP